MKPNYRLESGKLTVGAHSKGAELHSIKNKKGFEYLWQADVEIWPRHAPILFPIVGRLKENRYEYGGRQYNMTQHGFARDLEFKCLLQNRQELIFELCNNEITRANYPFNFRLQIHYRLEDDTLFSDYEVENPGNSKLYFSIGAHPGFNLSPANNSFAPTLTFQNSSLQLTGLTDGLLNNKVQNLILKDRKLNLNTELFSEDALILENEQVKRLSLLMNSEGRGLELFSEGWSYFGIWSKPYQSQLKFVCLEPWQGVADELESNGPLQQKKGILQLEPGARFHSGIKFRFF